MTSAFSWFNQILNGLFAGILWPFRGLAPIWGLIFISLVTGFLMVLIFGKISNQEKIKLLKNRIRGNLIGVRLFQHDTRVVFGLQGRIFRTTLTYMKCCLIPMLVLAVPVIIIMIQLNLHFAARPLKTGEPALVKARVAGISVMETKISLESPEEVSVETPGVRIESEGEVAWRIRAHQGGRFHLTVRVDDRTASKELVVGDGWGDVSPVRPGPSILDMLLFPGENPVNSIPGIRSIEVTYPPLPLRLAGWSVHWIVLFFVLSILFGFLVKGAVGVEL